MKNDSIDISIDILSGSKNFKVYWTYNLPLITVKKKSLRFIFNENSEELEKIILKTKPDIIINAMGLVSVDDCENNQVLAYNLNTKFVGHPIYEIKKNKKDVKKLFDKFHVGNQNILKFNLL